MNFNWLTSKTWWGSVIGAFGVVSSPAILSFLPPKVSYVITTIGGFLTVLGLRSAIATNGAGK